MTHAGLLWWSAYFTPMMPMCPALHRAAILDVINVMTQGVLAKNSSSRSVCASTFAPNDITPSGGPFYLSSRAPTGPSQKILNGSGTFHCDRHMLPGTSSSHPLLRGPHQDQSFPRLLVMVLAHLWRPRGFAHVIDAMDLSPQFLLDEKLGQPSSSRKRLDHPYPTSLLGRTLLPRRPRALHCAGSSQPLQLIGQPLSLASCSCSRSRPCSLSL